MEYRSKTNGFICVELEDSIVNRMFADYYEFSLQDDYYYPVNDYTPASLNREHEHDDVYEGAKKFSYNVEVIATDDERRRGSDALLLVDDRHYIWCSRTGMESAGNTIQISNSAPVELRYTVLETVFENVLQRKFGEIGDGVDTDSFNSDTLSIMTPRGFVLANELTKEELEEYFDELGDLTVTLLEEFYTTETPDDLKRIVEDYAEKRKSLYREYTDFTPTIASKVINSLEGINGWRMPEEIDAGKRLVVIMHETMDYGEDNTRCLNIVISQDETIELIEDINHEDTILQSKSYTSMKQLEQYIGDFMKCTPETVDEFR